MLDKITEKELRMQEALGSLPEEYRIYPCRGKTPTVSKGIRKCILCGLKCIHKGDEYYHVSIHPGVAEVSNNICKSCSWLTIQTINRITEEYNASQDKGKADDHRHPKTKVKGRVRKTTRNGNSTGGNIRR